MQRRSARFGGGVAIIILGGATGAPWAAGIPAVKIDEVVVTARRAGLIGHVDSASQGTVLAEQLENRPILRPGEVLEAVPGLIVTQHSGDGKANQYFLRGFSLDHGTDFATRVDGVPVNMPTHAHGQGYSDISFLIPELVGSVEYRKGTYYANEGNFSAAGAADTRYLRRIDGTLLQLARGEDSYGRALLASSTQLARGDVLLAIDHSRTDGPWVLEQDFRKVTGLAKFTRGDAERGFGVTAMAYDGRWHSTDQIPLRAVLAGEISRFGFVDPTDGGESHRYSLSGDWWRTEGETTWRAAAYAIDYDLDLISNFTYALDQENGDQFEQLDDRRVFGGSVGFETGNFAAGLQLRHDDIDPIGLYLTRERQRFETVREDAVTQTSYALHARHEVRPAEWLRATYGARVDHFRFDVTSDLTANSGSADDTLVSPKITLAFGPWHHTEYFVNVGSGYHSNDARGTTIRVDPADGVTSVERVDPLVRALGAELGLRTAAAPGIHVAASLWTLELDSELLFVGDAGATEATRGSRRTGVELGLFYTPRDWLVVDADLAWSRARFTDDDPAGDRIPGAVEHVASLGIAIDRERGWFGGARLRYLGDAPLIEDDSVRAGSTLLVNVEAGYRFSDSLSIALTAFNILDSRDNDIAYFYESQLPGEADPVEDIHFHPVEPRAFRAAVTLRL